MMTLEEAVNQFSTKDKSREQVSAAYAPWKSLVEEIAKADCVAQFIAGSLPYFAKDPVKAMYMLYSAGVLTGASMERQDQFAQFAEPTREVN